MPFAFALPLPPARVRTGRVLSGVAVLFLAFDAAMKLLQVPMAVEGTIQLGYPASSLLVIGLIQVVCLAVYLVPRTAILGAVLWTGYLGGAIATHLRVGNPLFTHMLFPITSRRCSGAVSGGATGVFAACSRRVTTDGAAAGRSNFW